MSPNKRNLMVGIVVLGVFSYARLRVEQMPDVTLPFVDIETAYPGKHRCKNVLRRPQRFLGALAIGGKQRELNFET